MEVTFQVPLNLVSCKTKGIEGYRVPKEPSTLLAYPKSICLFVVCCFGVCCFWALLHVLCLFRFWSISFHPQECCQAFFIFLSVCKKEMTSTSQKSIWLSVAHLCFLPDCVFGHQITKYNVHVLNQPVKIFLMETSENSGPTQFAISRSPHLERKNTCKFFMQIKNIPSTPATLLVEYLEANKGKVNLV